MVSPATGGEACSTQLPATVGPLSPVRDPESAIPRAAKKLACRQIREVVAEGRLAQQPKSVIEWQLVRSRLAEELKLSPLRIVFLFSEVSCSRLHQRAGRRNFERL